MMQPLYGGATARPFVTHHNTLDIDLYLRIAPELYLKRLVVGGLERVYEINRNFRNEGLSTHHNPEFTMLEFYQAYTDYLGLMDFSEALLKQAALDAIGSTDVEFDGHQLDFSRLERYTMREAVVRFWEGEGGPAIEDVANPEWLRLHSRRPTAGEALTEIFEQRVESKLIQPTIIYDYPVETSPLSKNKPDDPAFVERFEIYAAGMEIGNAYTELNDPQEQRRRFEMQIAMRERGDEEAHQMDEDYVRALAYAMPPTGGEGIGIDRLTMILTGSHSIRDVILFPLLRPEGPIDLVRQMRELDEGGAPASCANFASVMAPRLRGRGRGAARPYNGPVGAGHARPAWNTYPNSRHGVINGTHTIRVSCSWWRPNGSWEAGRACPAPTIGNLSFRKAVVTLDHYPLPL
jgi:lysyl-tRNA synthetase class 2